MPTLNFVGASGDTFQVDHDVKFWVKGVTDLSHLKGEVCSVLKKKIQRQFCDEHNIDYETPITEYINQFQKSELFKPWLNVGKTQYITLVFQDTVLDDNNYQNLNLKDGDTITYVISPRF